ncbi:hypothetical protein [Flavobacterium sp.]|uniref:hypothetical protein n=1 Tax=Flavobacterium sp. TaxID=239 RepID=UPI0038FCB40B
MKFSFQKALSFLGLNRAKFDPTPNARKRKRSSRKKGFDFVYGPTSVSYHSSTSSSKTNACLLILIIYVIIVVVLYHLVE